MKRDSALAKQIEFILSHDTSQLHIVAGIRNAVGVLIALLVAIAAGAPTAGLGVAIGAQVAGFAGLNGTVKRRLQTMLAAAVWMSMTTFIGGIIGGTWAAVIMIAALGFFGGFLICVSNEAGLIGMWATIAYILFSGFPHQSATAALVRGLLVLAGGVLQAVLMLIVEQLHHSQVELKSVAAVFSALSHYSKAPSRQADLAVATNLQTAAMQLRTSSLRVGELNKLQQLLDAAESIRIEVVALWGMIYSIRQESMLTATELHDLEKTAAELADFLSFTAAQIRSNQPVSAQNLRTKLESCYKDLSLERYSAEWRQLTACVQRACVEMLKAVELLQSPAETKADTGRENSWIDGSRSQLHNAMEALRANFTFRSATFRHAIRLACALAVAAIFELLLPFPRGYWLPLTTLVILRPEFATTFSRGIARVLGTLLGAVAATLILLIPDSQHIFGAVLVAILLAGMYTVLNYNLVLFSGILTAEVVVLLSFFQEVQPLATIDDRVLYTIGGSLLAFVAYLVWPTWLHRDLPTSLSSLIEAQSAYAEAVFALTVDCSAERRSSFRKRARLIRTNTVNLASQAGQEPAKSSYPREAYTGLLTALNRFSNSLLALESHLAGDCSSRQTHPDVVRFGNYVSTCLGEIQSAIHQDRWLNVEYGSANTENLRLGESPGLLDEISPYTKQELNEMDIPLSLRLIFIRIEDNLGTMFRMLSA